MRLKVVAPCFSDRYAVGRAFGKVVVSQARSDGENPFALVNRCSPVDLTAQFARAANVLYCGSLSTFSRIPE
jgi:hypothetical protein